MRIRQCQRRRSRKPNFTEPPFVADEMLNLSHDSRSVQFGASAFYVDEYKSVTLPVLGTPCLALRTHMPCRLANLDLARRVEDDDLVTTRLETLDDRSPSLWRCHIGWRRPFQGIYNLVGRFDNDVLAAFRQAELLFPIRATIWQQWDFTDAHLVIDNDRAMWMRIAG